MRTPKDSHLDDAVRTTERRSMVSRGVALRPARASSLATIAIALLPGCPQAAYPVPPPQPNLTHGFAADSSGSISPSIQGGGGYWELGRPSLAMFVHPNVTLLAGGTIGRIFLSDAVGGPTWFGADLEVRVGGV